MTAWWHKLPSLTPVKGLARFLYVVTHWEIISEELKKRDERLGAIDDAGRQLLRLQHEIHEAETRSTAVRTMNVLTKTIVDIEQRNQQLDEFTKRVDVMFDEFLDTIAALAMILYVEESPSVREAVLNQVPPRAREILNNALTRLHEGMQRQSLTPTRQPLGE